MTTLPPASRLLPAVVDGLNQMSNGDPASSSSSSSLAASSTAIPPYLSRHSSQSSYFDIRPLPNHYNTSSSSSASSHHLVYSPPVPGLPRSSQAFLSPQLPAVASYDKRSASLSPTRRGKLNLRTSSTVTSPSTHPARGLSPAALATSPPRSMSYESAVGPEAKANAQLIQRLTQQNVRILEGWETERRQLEASRDRADEIYKEERLLMDQERATWVKEKTHFEHEICHLQTMVADLRTEIHLLTQHFELERSGKVAGVSVSIKPSLLRNADGANEFGYLRGPPMMAGLQRGRVASDPPSSSAGRLSTSPQSTRTRYVSPTASRVSPTRELDVAPFASLDSQVRPAPGPPVADFLAPSSNNNNGIKIPSIDVQELHPDLEGIPLKATAIKKDTFKDGPSPTASAESSSQSASPTGEHSAAHDGSVGGLAPADVLSPEESRRLTMHAGHTPSHSLSTLPTVLGTEVATATADSGDVTPTQASADAAGQLSIGGPEDSAIQTKEIGQRAFSNSEEEALVPQEPEENFAPAGDVKLKGPLTVRNVPAFDEKFLRLVNEKLERYTSGLEPPARALTSRYVLSDKDDSHNGLENGDLDDNRSGVAKADNSVSTVGNGAEEEDEEEDIPLRIKTSLNFGAPLGEIF